MQDTIIMQILLIRKLKNLNLIIKISSQVFSLIFILKKVITILIYMKRKTFIFLIFFFTNLFLLNPILAETPLDVYMNDFYSKTNEAKQILKEIEFTLKEGSRSQVCSRQRKAAKLGLLANDSLIKAFEISGEEVPIEAIKASQLRWKSILNEC